MQNHLLKSVFLFTISPFSLIYGHSSESWTINPFDNKIFIENSGQFDQETNCKDKILFGAILGKIQVYFTKTGLIYRYEEPPKIVIHENEKDETYLEKPKIHFLELKWEGAGSGTTMEPADKQDYFFSYPSGKNSSVRTGGFKKIIYHNLYPGIDAEYFFPKGKEGIKYTLIIHPGADVSLVKLSYSETRKISLNEMGEVIINSSMGQFTDHTPECFFAENKVNVKAAFRLSGNQESFILDKSYDNSKTLILDPWSTNPNFAGTTDKAFDVDYDNNGNVYVYGGIGFPQKYQLIKLNSSGTIQWKFSAFPQPYGDFAVDRNTGTSYIVQGSAAFGAAARAMKVNSAGNLIAEFQGDSAKNGAVMNEMWRVVYDPCTGKLIIGAGGTSDVDGGMLLDTSMLQDIRANVLHATNSAHDIALLARDPSGTYCYMAAAANCCDKTLGDVLVQLPVSTLTPYNYLVSDGFGFTEIADTKYKLGSIGMNGMTASVNWLYMYNGDTLQQRNKSTGAFNNSVVVANNKPYDWGGLDVDLCDNIYAGVKNKINVYNSSLALTNTISLPDTVYDLVLGFNYQVIYACGDAFVSSIPAPSIITKTRTASSSCACDASASLQLCGNASPPGLSFNWSNGQNTSSLSGLCNGIYTVTVTTSSPACTSASLFIDTLQIFSSGPANIKITSVVTDNVCYGSSSGSISLSANGGNGMYNYRWSPSGGLGPDITGLSAGNYSCTVTDQGGCSASTIVSVSQPAEITINSITAVNASCGMDNGSIIANASGGSSLLTYSWNIGITGMFINNLSAGIYTLTITDANGCSISSSATLLQIPKPTAYAGVNEVILRGQRIQLFASGGLTYSWTPVESLNNPEIYNPVADPHQTTNYIVTVTDGYGCSATDSVLITVEECDLSEFFVPSAFSPNGDGQNDFLFVRGPACISKMKFIIFDRWGEMVFESTDPGYGWDGKFNGKNLDAGVFVYYLNVNLSNGQSLSRKGNITLLK